MKKIIIIITLFLINMPILGLKNQTFKTKTNKSFKKSPYVYFTPALRSNIFFKDAESRYYIFKIISPIFKNVKIDPNEIDLYFCNNSEVNAFVSIQNMMFLNIGLFLKVSCEAFVGIIAHEMGHILYNHPMAHAIVSSQINKKIKQISLISASLALLSSNKENAVLGLSAGSWAISSSFLNHSRRQENQADDVAFHTLNNLKWPLSGLKRCYQNFWEKHQKTVASAKNFQEYLFLSDPYLATHPMAYERVYRLSLFEKKYDNKNRLLPKHFHFYYSMVRAKLYAYSVNDADVINALKKKFLGKDDLGEYKLDPIAFKYYKSILNMRVNNYAKALKIINEIIISVKDEGVKFFLNIYKADILFHSNKTKEAFDLYKKIIPKRHKWDMKNEIIINYIWFLLNCNNSHYTKLAYEQLLSIDVPKKQYKEHFYWDLRAMACSRMNQYAWVFAAKTRMLIIKEKKKEAKAMLERTKKYLINSKKTIVNKKLFDNFIKDLESQIKN